MFHVLVHNISVSSRKTNECVTHIPVSPGGIELYDPFYYLLNIYYLFIFCRYVGTWAHLYDPFYYLLNNCYLFIFCKYLGP